MSLGKAENELTDRNGKREIDISDVPTWLYFIGGGILLVDLFFFISLTTATSDLIIITNTIWFVGLLIISSVFIAAGIIIYALSSLIKKK